MAFWWVARGELGASARDIVEGVHGRVILRDSAVDFLDDLGRRLAVFAEHPTGATPAVVHDATLALLRAGDTIGLAEELRRERQQYDAAIEAVTVYALENHGSVTADALQAVWARLRPALERRVAALLPLALYDDQRFGQEISALARSLERQPLRGGLTAWIETRHWAATWTATCAAPS